MKQTFKNIFDSWVTTILGIAVVVLDLVLIWNKVFDFIWEGAVGVGLGALLIMASDNIGKMISDVISGIFKTKKTTDDQS